MRADHSRTLRGLVLGAQLAMGAVIVAPLTATAEETAPEHVLTKTRLVLKLQTPERVAVRSHLEPNPPTIVIEFPSGRVAGSLPERSAIQRGAVEEIRTIYSRQAARSGEPRWIKALSIEMRGHYNYAVHVDAGEVIVEIDHPADIANGAYEVGLGSGAIVSDESNDQWRQRFQAMQDALMQAAPTSTPSQATNERARSTPTGSSASAGSTAAPASSATVRQHTAPKPSRNAGWLILGLGLIGSLGVLIWMVRRLSVSSSPRGRNDHGASGTGVIDQLVWRAFEQQGYQLLQANDSNGSAGPLRLVVKDGTKSLMQCVNDGVFFEKSSVERFTVELQKRGVEQGFLVASGSFTVPAQRFAKEHGVTLIGREQLAELLSAGAMQEQYAKRLQEIDGQLQKAQETLEEYANQLDMIRRQRNESTWLLGEERAKAAKVEADRAALMQQIEQWKAQTEQWQAAAELNHKRWEDSQWYLGESRAFGEHLETQFRQLQESYQQLERRVQELTEILQATEKERDEAKWYLSESQKAQAVMETQLGDVQARATKLQEGLDAMRRDLDESQRELETQRSARQQLEEQMGSLAKPHVERRKVQRMSLKDALIGVQDASGGVVFRGTPKDVSIGGFGLECDEPIKFPDLVRVRLALPGIPDTLELTARLVWARDYHASNRASSGYEFTDISTETREAIEQLLTRAN